MRARFAAVGVLVMVLSVLSVAPYAAGESPVTVPVGNGPDTAPAPPRDWQSLEPGQRTWYAFDYAGDRSQIEVVMEVNVPGALDFTVWTPADVKSWQGTGIETSVGEGHANPALHDALSWSGNFNAEGTYYVVVDHTSGDPSLYKAASFWLKITGSGVSFPVRRPARQPAPTPTLAPPGSAPADAVSAVPGGGSGTLGQGQVSWYAFTALGDNSQITVHLISNPPNKATFSVWTLEEVQMFTAYGEENPVGRSAPNSRYNGDQVWSGNFTVPGKYYVRVEQTGSDAPVTYRLQIK